MYVPRHFENTDLAALHAAIETHALGVLVTEVEGRLEATHVPVVLDRDAGEHGALRFHLAGANPSAGVLGPQREALLVFGGPATYVSPDWYASPHQVPTWNYVAVHVYGMPERMDDPALATLLDDLSRSQEGRLPKPPWTVDKLPADLYASLRRAIVGFRLPIARIEGKWKLGQNRKPADRAGVVAALRALGGETRLAVAEAMASLDREPDHRDG